MVDKSVVTGLDRLAEDRTDCVRGKRLGLIAALVRLWPGEFKWREPPYEYETERLPIDILLGNDQIRPQIEAGRPVQEIEAGWKDQSARFLDRRKRHLLYR